MFMVKVLCVIGAMAAACLIGITESWRLKLRVKQLESILLFFQQMEEEIRYAANPILEIIAAHGEDMAMLGICRQRMREGMTFPEAWQASIDAECGRLTKADRQYLAEFGSAFGGMDQAGQLSACQLTKERLNFQLAAAKKDVEQKAKLYRSLGMLGSAGILLAAV